MERNTNSIKFIIIKAYLSNTIKWDLGITVMDKIHIITDTFVNEVLSIVEKLSRSDFVLTYKYERVNVNGTIEFDTVIILRS